MIYIKNVKISTPKKYENHFNKTCISAFLKQDVNTKIFVDKCGLLGDKVADNIHHGGEFKAVFANSFENFSHFSKFLGQKCTCLGENLIIQNLSEKNVFIGDIHEVGSCILQVTQPRKPCYKISYMYNNKNFANYIYESGKSGWYYKVLKAGFIQKNDIVKVQKVGKFSILDTNKIFYNPKNFEEKILDLFFNDENILQSYKNQILQKMNKNFDLSYMHL